MPSEGYIYQRADLADLLLRQWYPERTNRESTIIRDFLIARGHNYDRFEFSRKVGPGVTPNPSHLPGVQRNAVESSRRRIDVLCWQGNQPVIVECKERVRADVLGQVLHYRQLLMAEIPEIPTPELLVIARYSDPQTLQFLQENGITVYLYEPTDAS